MPGPRAVIDCRVVSPRLDGLGRYTIGLIGGMLRLPQPPDIRLLVPSNLAADHPLRLLITATGVPMVQVTPGLFTLKAHAAIPLVVRRLRPDVYHYPHFNVPIISPARTVATIHDLTPLTDPEYFKSWAHAKRAYFRLALGHTLSRAHVIISPSQATADEMRRHFKVTTRIATIAEGVEDAFETPQESAITAFRERYALSRPYLLYVGVRRPHKNLRRVTQAFARIAPIVPHDFVLVGAPPTGRDELGELADELGISHRVRSLGYLPEPELPLAYACCDGFVLCSTAEGFGLGVLEAFRMGAPVVTAQTGATAEVAGDSAILVDPLSVDSIARGLQAVCLDSELRVAMRRRGHQRVASFTWERAARATADVYRSAIA